MLTKLSTNINKMFVFYSFTENAANQKWSPVCTKATRKIHCDHCGHNRGIFCMPRLSIIISHLWFVSLHQTVTKNKKKNKFLCFDFCCCCNSKRVNATPLFLFQLQQQQKSKQRTHCYFTRSNLKKMGPLQFFLLALLGIHRHHRQK